MQQPNTDTSDSQDQRDPTVCSVCGEPHQLGHEIGNLPLSIRICGCGVVIEYDPWMGSGEPCPICPALEGKEAGEGFMHTHKAELGVFGPDCMSGDPDLNRLIRG